MYISKRNCPKCNSIIEHESVKSQKQADSLRDNADSFKKLCRSCIATNVNNRRWSKKSNREKQSQRWTDNNPSKNGVWNKGIERDVETRKKISDTIRLNGGRSGNRNSNYGNFKEHNLDKNFKIYASRVAVLTERNRFNIPGYDENKRGRAGVEGKYQIDHIKSIIDCWFEKIPAEQAASVSNLQFISWEDNLKKRAWKRKNENNLHSS